MEVTKKHHALLKKLKAKMLKIVKEVEQKLTHIFEAKKHAKAKSRPVAKKAKWKKKTKS